MLLWRIFRIPYNFKTPKREFCLCSRSGCGCCSSSSYSSSLLVLFLHIFFLIISVVVVIIVTIITTTTIIFIMYGDIPQYVTLCLCELFSLKPALRRHVGLFFLTFPADLWALFLVNLSQRTPYRAIAAINRLVKRNIVWTGSSRVSEQGLMRNNSNSTDTVLIHPPWQEWRINQVILTWSRYSTLMDSRENGSMTIIKKKDLVELHRILESRMNCCFYFKENEKYLIKPERN